MSDIQNDKIDPKAATVTLDKDKDPTAAKEDPSIKQFETHPQDVGNQSHVDILSEQSQFHVVPAAGQVDSSVTAIQAQSDRGSGVSPARPYTVVSNEGSVDGMMYTNSTGSTFKTLDGKDSYKVDFQDNGKVNLEPHNAETKPITEASLQRSVNPLNENVEPMVKPRPAATDAAPPPTPKVAEKAPAPEDTQPKSPEVKAPIEAKVNQPVEQAQTQEAPRPQAQPAANVHDNGAAAGTANNNLNFAPAQVAHNDTSPDSQRVRPEPVAPPVMTPEVAPAKPALENKTEPVEEKDKSAPRAPQNQAPSPQPTPEATPSRLTEHVQPKDPSQPRDAAQPHPQDLPPPQSLPSDLSQPRSVSHDAQQHEHSTPTDLPQPQPLAPRDPQPQPSQSLRDTQQQVPRDAVQQQQAQRVVQPPTSLQSPQALQPQTPRDAAQLQHVDAEHQQLVNAEQRQPANVDQPVRAPLEQQASLASQRPATPEATHDGNLPARNLVPTDTEVARPVTPGGAIGKPVTEASHPSDATVLKGSISNLPDAAVTKAAMTNVADASAVQKAPLDAQISLQAADAKRLQQFGLDAKDPQTQTFLLDARKQLNSLQSADGVPQNITLAEGLKGLNPQQADKLAAFLTNNPAATADKVILSNSLLARLNVMYAMDKPTTATIQALAGQRPGASDLATATGAADSRALKIQALSPQTGATESSVVKSPTTVRELAGQQLILQQMAQFLRSQNLSDQQGLASTGSLYAQLNRLINDANTQPAVGAKPVVLSDLVSRTIGTPPPPAQTFVLHGDLIASGNLDQILPSRLGALNIGKGPLTADTTHPTTLEHAEANTAVLPNVLDASKLVTGKQPVTEANTKEPFMPEKIEGKDEKDQPVKPGKDALGDAIKGKPTASLQEAVDRMTAAMLANKDAKFVDHDETADHALTKKPLQPGELDELDEHGQPKKKKVEADARPDHKVDDAALMALMAARKLKEDKDLKEKEDQQEKDKKKKEDSQRRKYVVKEKDTLESIAMKQCRDVRLAALIFEINQEVLQKSFNSNTKGGKEVLVPGTVIWLPSVDDIERFRARLGAAVAASGDKLSPEEELARKFGEHWAGADGASTPGTPDGAATASGADPTTDVSGAASAASAAAAQAGQDFRVSLLAAAVEASKKRKQNVENILGPIVAPKEDGIRYVVRLGDSLKSIAMKHPGLQDVTLWELLAQINNISTECDARGIPLEKLGRGMKIRIPSLAEIEAYREQNRKPEGAGLGSASAAHRPGSVTLTLPAMPATDAASKMLSAGGFDNKPVVAETKPEAAASAPILEKPTITAAEIDNQVANPNKAKAIENIRKLSDDCRIVRRHLANPDGSRCYQAQLDILVRNAWQTVIVYNISDNDNWCKRLGLDGNIEKEQLEMPVPLIHQTLENDFSLNWQDYRDQFIAS